MFGYLFTGALLLDFCGHRIHINKSFQLVMTTGCPSVLTTHQTLSCHLHLINASPSLPLTIELLLQDITNGESSFPLAQYSSLMVDIRAGDIKRRDLNQLLFKQMGKVTNGIVDSHTITQVEQLINDFYQVSLIIIFVYYYCL